MSHPDLCPSSTDGLGLYKPVFLWLLGCGCDKMLAAQSETPQPRLSLLPPATTSSKGSTRTAWRIRRQEFRASPSWLVLLHLVSLHCSGSDRVLASDRGSRAVNDRFILATFLRPPPLMRYRTG
jgi:hypothetical protein